MRAVWRILPKWTLVKHLTMVAHGRLVWNARFNESKEMFDTIAFIGNGIEYKSCYIKMHLYKLVVRPYLVYCAGRNCRLN